MSKNKEQALISILPYPAKKVFSVFAIINGLVIIALIIISRVYGTNDFVSYHIRTSAVLLLIFLQLIIFSGEKEEDERVQLIRYRTILNIIYFGFILIIINYYFKFIGGEISSDFNYTVLYIIILALQSGYLVEFRKNLRKDADWIYDKLNASNGIKVNPKKLTLLIIICIVFYYAGIYLLKWFLPILYNLLEAIL